MFGLEILAKILKILRSDDTPAQIAVGFSLGMILGLTPFFTLHNVLVILIVIIFKVNLGSVIFSFALFSGLAYLLDPLFHSLGYFLLVDVPALHGLWTFFYQFPIIALSRYNNTVVMGSLAVSLLLFLPVTFGVKLFVIYYRKTLDPKIQQLKIVQLLKSTKFYAIYKKIQAVRQG
ncbi:Conserved hypothetical protein CHP03546 [Caldithrix abyssi DSM 13497]|uniref:TIGR03546 family protein n=1 Tax=Caldithrix abyssi DSM 13497 TaxID=880073 RepID=H1XW30_CALAY|nr:TIGR03546 family protein [Caldithrix abyssi]APF17720.1 TIGR03546 family protein [Caldithrix abyssi DSM 13497]EHO41802.1 Conserved hypothetical protein CHP03546 [Caldithrix abyssi DSM 13497]